MHLTPAAQAAFPRWLLEDDLTRIAGTRPAPPDPDEWIDLLPIDLQD